MSSITRNINRISGRDRNESGEESIADSRNSCTSSPFQAYPIMLATLVLGSLVAAFKGVYRDSDLMIFGGTAFAMISGSVLMLWILSHLPLAIWSFSSLAPCYMILSHGLEIST